MTDGKETRRGFIRVAGAAVFGGAASAPTGATATTPNAPAPGPADLDVRQFGAKADGTTLDTPAINKAIEAAIEAGGGTVHFPAGTYLSYSIHLKSNVRLFLSSGSTILAADPLKEGQPGYDLAESNQPWEGYQDFGHNHWHNSLLWGEGLHNVSICGPGLIWGKGLSRGEGEGPVAETPGVGNKAIALKNCRDVC